MGDLGEREAWPEKREMATRNSEMEGRSAVKADLEETGLP